MKKKKRTGATKGKNVGASRGRKPTVKTAKTKAVGASGFFLKVSGPLAKSLATAAKSDKAFNGKSTQRYALNVLKKTAEIAPI